MIQGTIVLVVLITSSASLADEIEVSNEIKHALINGLSSSIKSSFTSLLETIPLETFLKKQPVEDEDMPLNSTIIVKALYNLKEVLGLPERIPMIPFAVAQPITKNVLLYFGILDSSFLNLTQFTADASVNNTNSSTSVSVNLHFNTTGLEGHYELDVSNYDMHLFGDGNYSIINNDTDITIATAVNIFPNNSFFMTDFIVGISVNSTKIMMSNLLNGDPSAQTIVDALAQVTPMEISALNPFIKDTVNRTVVDFTNSVLTEMSWKDIVSIIEAVAGY